MKKEIIALVNSKEGRLKINNYCTLERWTKSALNEDVDRLRVVFSITHVQSHTFEIQSREWRDIVDEVVAAQTKAFAEAASEYNKQLTHGYIG